MTPKGAAPISERNRRDSVWTGVALSISWKPCGPTGFALEGL